MRLLSTRRVALGATATALVVMVWGLTVGASAEAAAPAGTAWLVAGHDLAVAGHPAANVVLGRSSTTGPASFGPSLETALVSARGVSSSVTTTSTFVRARADATSLTLLPAAVAGADLVDVSGLTAQAAASCSDTSAAAAVGSLSIAGHAVPLPGAGRVTDPLTGVSVQTGVTHTSTSAASATAAVLIFPRGGPLSALLVGTIELAHAEAVTSCSSAGAGSGSGGPSAPATAGSPATSGVSLASPSAAPTPVSRPVAGRARPVIRGAPPSTGAAGPVEAVATATMLDVASRAGHWTASARPAPTPTGFPAPTSEAGLLAALPTPGEVRWDAPAVARSAGVVAAAVLLVAFPGELLAIGVEEHRHAWRRLFDAPARRVAGAFGWLLRAPTAVVFGVCALGNAALFCLLDPTVSASTREVPIVLGLLAAVVVVTLGFDVPEYIFVRLRHGHTALLKVVPESVVVTGLCVLVCRLAGVQPGYFYGVVAGLAIQGALPRRDEGLAGALSAALVLALAVGAWFAWVPLHEAALHGNTSFAILLGDSALGMIACIGVESVAIGLLPLPFLDGHRVLDWSRAGWLVLFGLAMFGVVHVLFDGRTGYVSRADVVSLAFFAGMAALSLGTWGRVAWRSRRMAQSVPALAHR